MSLHRGVITPGSEILAVNQSATRLPNTCRYTASHFFQKHTWYR